jgi:peptide/nickel transport system ATP-binding protein
MLDIEDLSVTFTRYRTGLKKETLTMISHLNLSVSEGNLLAVAGSSGSGKSLLAHAILGILPRNAAVTGTIRFKGDPLTPERVKGLRGQAISLIPQSVNHLDPLMRVGEQIRKAGRKPLCRHAVDHVFKRYGLKKNDGRLFPFQLSGGMSRRILVCSAVTGAAGLIIADEPTPGLHPRIVRETLGHLRELADEGRAVLVITHDLGTIKDYADHIAVMFAGSVVETAPSSDFESNGERLRHPYSRALWQALPQNGFMPIPGSQPCRTRLPEGCLFSSMCPEKTRECDESRPPMRDLRSGTVRCIHAV